RFAARDLEGKRVLVTAGPTRESIDPVRYISNRSSGKMGFAVAQAAQMRGARVTLISGPTSLSAPQGVEIVPVTTAAEMLERVLAAVDEHDLVVKAAAVADFTPADPSSQKIKKGSADDLVIRLRKTPDILEAIAGRAKRPFTVAFAAETEKVDEHARAKLAAKRVDLIVANDVSDASIGFDSDQNAVTLIDPSGTAVQVDKASKLTIANRILDRAIELMK
ncbi:MAG TPA: bifunctional phosphopantothenoylcysteine decarboxylase/phosphopantothenate--cysteine ligase CoaBC, partial [Thermoanaerobaculia bacterium]|nr:bifunctional phosphopantothenoylcysteine decarboxylase/phosphopantothenate--cysteine ligase CoaBC [Thermoanaerobaculia bacterium]